jgi:hypothetical protein
MGAIALPVVAGDAGDVIPVNIGPPVNAWQKRGQYVLECQKH